MLERLLLIEGVVLGCIGAGWLIGRFAGARIRKAEVDGVDSSDGGDLTDALAFVGAAFGILLGLLLVFAVQHYNDSATAVRNETISAVSVFRAASTYPAAEREVLRRDTLCTMRSIVEDDFPETSRLETSGSPMTSQWGLAVQRDIESLTQDTPAQQSTHQIITGEALEWSKERQLRLVSSSPEIPTVIWLVIFMCTFGFALLLVIHLGRRDRLAAVSLISVSLVLLVIIGSLVNLDFPFSGDGGSIEPVSMRNALTSLEAQYPATDWSPCPASPPTLS